MKELLALILPAPVRRFLIAVALFYALLCAGLAVLNASRAAGRPRLIWTASVASQPDLSLDSFFADGLVVLRSSASSTIQALDAAGSLVWKYKTAGNLSRDDGSIMRLGDGIVYYDLQGRAGVLSAAGELLFEVDPATCPDAPPGSSALYALQHYGGTIGLDSAGRAVWRADEAVRSTALRMAKLEADALLCVDERAWPAHVLARDSAGHELWRVDLGAELARQGKLAAFAQGGMSALFGPLARTADGVVCCNFTLTPLASGSSMQIQPYGGYGLLCIQPGGACVIVEGAYGDQFGPSLLDGGKRVLCRDYSMRQPYGPITGDLLLCSAAGAGVRKVTLPAAANSWQGYSYGSEMLTTEGELIYYSIEDYSGGIGQLNSIQTFLQSVSGTGGVGAVRRLYALDTAGNELLRHETRADEWVCAMLPGRIFIVARPEISQLNAYRW